jgi:hypothetical protein
MSNKKYKSLSVKSTKAIKAKERTPAPYDKKIIK